MSREGGESLAGPLAAAAEPPAEEMVSLYEKWRKIYPLWVNGGFQTGRRIVLLFLLLVFYVSPWLQWNGQPGVYFDLANRRFTLLWATFVPEEFVLLAWTLLIAALLLFTVTIAAGRVFCGWACPQTVWSFVYFAIERWVEGDRAARVRLDRGPWNRRRISRKALKYFLWSIVALSISITFVGYFEPIRELLPKILRWDLTGWEQFALAFPAAGSFLMSGVLREQVCFHMCPYARFQSVMFDHDSLIISYDVERGEDRGSRKRSADPEALGLGSCIDCRKCVSVCPTGIDIRDGLQYQCIGCAACVDACADVMKTMGYGESLVRYSSQSRDEGGQGRWIRPRLAGYVMLVVCLIGALGYTIQNRVPLGFDVARDRNRLYRENWDGAVENVYTLHIENRAARERAFAIAFDSELPLTYEGPKTIVLAGEEEASIPVRLVLSGEGSRQQATQEDVTFRVEAIDESATASSKISLFHLPVQRSTP